MNITRLLFNETLATLKIGKKINPENDLDIITAEECDIPGIRYLTIGNIDFEIIVLHETVLGIQYDFDYDRLNEIFIEINNSTLFLNQDLTSTQLSDFLQQNKISFDRIESNQEPFAIKLNESKSKFFFNEEARLFKISVFDMELFNHLSGKKNHY